MAKKQEAKNEVAILIPLADPPATGYEREQADRGIVAIDAPDRLHVNAQLGRDAALAFLRIWNGLREAGARLSNGREVWTKTDVLRWLMEKVAEEVA